MIRVHQVSKSFADVHALVDVSFEIGDGESLGIVGPSGSGKTTLLRIIAGLEVPDSGAVSIDSEEASSPERIVAPSRRNIGFVFQRPALWPHMTVAQNILFPIGHLPRREATRRVAELLKETHLVGLERRRPDELSAGQARRVALARALVAHPKYLLMDEPLTNLDPEQKIRMLQLIRSFVTKTGASLVYVTHDQTEAGELSHRVIRLVNGRVEPYP